MAWESSDTTITVRDFSDPTAALQTIASKGNDFVLAGKYLAYRRSPLKENRLPVVVIDVITGATVFSTEPSRDTAFSLADDGTLAVTTVKKSCGGSVRWYTPAEPTAHRTPLENLCGRVLVASGGTLVTTRRGATAGTVELVSGDLRSGSPKVVTVAPAYPDEDSELFLVPKELRVDDFDGKTVLYVRSTCSQDELWRADVTSPLSAQTLAASCQPAIGNGPQLRASKSGKVIIDVRCPLGECGDTASFTVKAGSKVLAARRPDPGDADLWDKRNLIDLKLTKAARATLAKKGRIAAQIVVTTVRLDGKNETVTKNVTIVR
jgi:hypothetical protein